MRRIGIGYNWRYMKMCGILSPKDFFEYLSKQRIKNLYVQLGEEAASTLFNKKELENLANIREKFDLEVVVHHPQNSTLTEKNFDLQFKKILDACKILNSRFLVIHFPEVSTNHDRMIAKKLDYAESVRINICLENIPTGYYSKIENIINFIKNNPNYNLVFDPGHLNVALANDLSQLYRDSEKLGDVMNKVKVLHVHLNDGKKDSHSIVCPHRDGKLNAMYFIVKEIIKKFSNAVIIEESYPKNENDLKNMINLLHLIDSRNI